MTAQPDKQFVVTVTVRVTVRATDRLDAWIAANASLKNWATWDTDDVSPSELPARVLEVS